MRKTILLADDSVTIQKVVELTFMEEDVEVITVGTGSEALERLEEVAPDLVIADVHMPGADGFEVCRAVKASRPEVPVLLLVGTFEPFDPDQATAAGGDAFLKKPFDSQELIRVAERLLEGGGSEAEEAEEEGPLETEEERDLAADESAEEAEPAAMEMTVEAGEWEEAVAAEGQPAPAAAPDRQLSDEEVDRVARRVVELLAPDTVREVAWEVVPDLAEVVIKDRLRELEGQVE
ncbi:MAG: response regulator [Thermoanaerobaculia bacterium]|nr:response regulator [Thermoanaerobaculia bacterium]